MKAIGFTDFEVDGIITSRPIFALTDVDHGVSLAGNYILVGNTAGELRRMLLPVMALWNLHFRLPHWLMRVSWWMGCLLVPMSLNLT